MAFTQYRTKLFSLLSALIAAAACATVLLYSGEAADAVRRGIEICGVSVIPSLFPMMFLSQYIVKSGAAELAGKLLDKPVRFLFGLPGICGIALLTAFVGGYPAGAKAAESFVESGMLTRREGERLANMAFCAGPGFAIGMIGANLYKNKTVGLLILTAQALSCIIIGITHHIISGGTSLPDKNTRNNTQIAHTPDAFVRSAADAASTMLNMCSFIILFQVIISMLDTVGVNSTAGKAGEALGMGEWGNYLLPCLSEVTAGSILSVKGGLPFTAFIAGFGGFSVHFQNFALCRAIKPRKSVYIMTRFFQGMLCGILVYAALQLPLFSSVDLPTAGTVIDGSPAQFSQVSVEFGCIMLVMCLMSVICLPPNRFKEKITP